MTSSRIVDPHAGGWGRQERPNSSIALERQHLSFHLTCTNERKCLQIGKSYSSAREALLLNGNFVIGQLKAHDSQHSTTLTDSPLVIALKNEVCLCL